MTPVGDGSIIVRDPDDIRPARPINPQEIDQVFAWYRRLPDLFDDDRIRTMCEIGFKLRCWHDLLPTGAWARWREIYLAEIPSTVVARCFKSWDDNEKISKKMGWRTPYYLGAGLGKPSVEPSGGPGLVKFGNEHQNASLGHLEASSNDSKAFRIRLIAQKSGISVFEESKGKLIYGYTLAVMPAKNKDYGRNAWYLPNWVLDYALAAMPKLADELAKAKEKRRALRDVLRVHQQEWKDWLASAWFRAAGPATKKLREASAQKPTPAKKPLSADFDKPGTFKSKSGLSVPYPYRNIEDFQIGAQLARLWPEQRAKILKRYPHLSALCPVSPSGRPLQSWP
jgi:hypothetical protein